MKGPTSHSVLRVALFFWFLPLICVSGCSSSSKTRSTEKASSLNPLHGKRVALVEIQGEETPRRIAEVALINQLARRGTFFLVPKNELDQLRAAPDLDPNDTLTLAKRAHADYQLRIEVNDFQAPIREGYSTQIVKDSQIAAEMGTDGSTEQVYKVKSLEGSVRFQLHFTDTATGVTTSGTAAVQKRVEADAQKQAIHLPPQLRFLEELTNQAFNEYFAHSD